MGAPPRPTRNGPTIQRDLALRNVLPPLVPGTARRPAIPGASVNSSFTTFVVPSNQITGWRNGQIVTPAQVNAAFSSYYAGNNVPQNSQLRPRLNYDQYVVSYQSFIGRIGSTPSSYQFIRPHPSSVQRAATNREQTIIRGAVRGYQNQRQFQENMQGLVTAARRDGVSLYGQGGFGGLPSTNQQSMLYQQQGFVGIRGSAITGMSAQRGTTFREHGAFQNRSDLDVFIVLPPSVRPVGRPFASPSNYPNIYNWAQSTQRTLGRDVSVMIRNGNVLRNPFSTLNQEAYISVGSNGALSHWVLPPGF